MADLEKVRTLAKDLTKAYPRSPREMLGGYVIGARCADLFAFTGITPDQFKEIVATGATDEELGAWINVHSKVQDRQAVIEWNNKMRDLRLSEMAPAVQAYMEDYIPKYVPTHRPVYTYFDVYDLEEKRVRFQRPVLDVKGSPGAGCDMD